MDNVITPKQAEDLIKGTKGHLFGVTFQKKDNTERNMVARLGVRKGVKGVKDFREQDERFGYIRAYDFNADDKGGFRLINLATLTRVKYKGTTYIVEEE